MWSYLFSLQFSRDCGTASDRCLQLGAKKDTGNSSGFSIHRALIWILWWVHFDRNCCLIFFPSSFFAENIPKCPILVRCNGPYRQCVETPSTFVFFFLVYSLNNHHQTLQEVFYELSFCAKSGKRACAALLLRCSLYILTSRLLCMGLKRGYLWQLEVVSVFHSRTAVRGKYSRPGEGVGGWGAD